ncbi:MAG: hypothetical protein DI598_18760 [Pseudopedobacter saltans]|uniref:Uncharacterized protein n=1 Tax=Pseudopedobacter saltans TaxID=151895 RepID=A0A2W5EII2_9SPHI|nr:MAG: hypothetical protein DI598_18760 [Pseudopedobacter saltans]
MALFFQRVGPVCYLKTYISVHIYKEQPELSVNTSKGKLVAHNLFCTNNRIYEECGNITLQTPVMFPEKDIRYFETPEPHSKDFVCIAVVLKRTSLRGPPSTC